MLLTVGIAKSKSCFGPTLGRPPGPWQILSSLFEIVRSKKVETSERWDHEK